MPLVQVRELVPDAGCADALEALTLRGLPAGHVLVVTHLPLIAELALGLTDRHVNFLPGTLAEIELGPDRLSGVLKRVLERA